MKKKYTLTFEDYINLKKKLKIIKKKVILGLSDTYPCKFKLINKALQDIIDDRFNLPENEIVSRISIKKKIKIKATNGTTLISEAKDIFGSDIHSDFIGMTVNINDRSHTLEQPVEVFEMLNKDANFIQIFQSLQYSLDNLCLTQNQIVCFCKCYSNWLAFSESSTFFLFKHLDNYFVAIVKKFSTGLSIEARQFAYYKVWESKLKNRMVIPIQCI